MTAGEISLDDMSATTNPALAPAVETSPEPLAELEHASSPARDALQSLLLLSALTTKARRRRDAGSLEDPAVNEFVLDEVLQLVAERARSITGADGVAIALAEDDAIVCCASAGEIAPDAGVMLDPNSGFSGACFRSGEIIRCNDTESDTRMDVEVCRKLGARSLVAVPLRGQKAIFGVLEAFSFDAHGFNDSDVQSLTLLAELILAAMKPQDEDRMAQISERVSARALPPPQTVLTNTEAPEPEPDRMSPEIPAKATPSAATDPGHPGLRVVFAVVFVAAALGIGLWWKMAHTTQAVMPRPQAAATATAAVQAVAQETSVSQPESDSDLLSSPPKLSDAEIKQKLALLPQVTGIRHWSSSEGSTVVVDLQEQVQYEAHRLTDPVRIYVDLHDTALSPGLFGKTIEVGDSLLMRVRLAQPMPGVTRVVLETSGGTNFSVSLEPNPYRLVVQVRPIGTPSKPNARVDLFSPMTPAEGNQLASSGESREDVQLRAHVPRFRIALDAGHGGWDLGTVGRQGLLEKDLVLDIVDRLGNLIQKRLGADVIYTRQDDDYISLEKRTEIANQSQADIFLSVHANYSVSASARGVETYYTNTFSSIHARTPGTELQDVSFANVDIREKVQESHKFATAVQRALHSALAAGSSGIPDRGVKAASYVVLTGTSMPAILAEVSFVSSPTDEENLQSAAYRQRIAEALYKGVARYEATPRKVKLASAEDKRVGQ